MSPGFRSTRSDGRSDRQVLFDLTEAAEPETTFTYDELIKVLSEGLVRQISRDRVYRAVASTNKLLLRERQRYLSVIENVGYRVIRADEHLPTALTRKSRADVQLQRGMDLLRNARLDELDDNQRALHEGQLLVLGGLVQAMQESTRRQDRIDKMFQEMNDRLDRLEK